MGVWGYGPFDNDAAADLVSFVTESSGSRGWRLVERALGDLRSIPDVIAAGEIVASALGRSDRRDRRVLSFAISRGTVSSWAQRHVGEMPARLPSYALSQVKKAARQRLGWNTREGERAWSLSVESVIRRLEMYFDRGGSRRRGRS